MYRYGSVACAIALMGLLVPVRAEVPLVPWGAEWRYLDDGSDQGTNWTGLSYQDAAWSNGVAELGYGDGDEATVVDYGGVSTNKHITTYFRKEFTVDDPAAFILIRLKAVIDDGAVFHINGTEVERLSMPAGTVSNSTLASVLAGGSSESLEHVFELAPGVLQPGTNMVAVEVHQGDAESSDISFNMELAGITDAGVVRGPYLQRVSDDEITVCWRSIATHTGNVFYGLSETALTNNAFESQAGIDHAVRLEGLEPDTTYHYQIHDGTNVLAGGTNHFFQTAPMPGDGSYRRIWVLGDSGTADANAAAVYEAYRTYNGSQYTDLMLMLGDNAYYSGTDAEYQQAVFDTYPEMLRQTPWFSCYGNHDGYSADSATQTGPYYDIFTLPAAGECGGVPSGTEAYYSFDFGNIHFVCLDSFETARDTNGTMYAWLAADLAANTSDWLIAFWHHPPYTKGSHDSDTEGGLIDMRQNFLPLLEGAGVDLVMAGHSHLYERSYLIHDHYGDSSTFHLPYHAVDAGDGSEPGGGVYEKASTGSYAGKGAVYMVAGSSGWVSGTQPGFPHPAMATNQLRLGSAVLDVAGTRLDARFLDSAGVVRDSFSILKVEVGAGDSDGDGLPDDWEQFYFGNPTNAVAIADADADRLDNLSEYIADTHPQDPASVLALDASIQSNGNILVRWPSSNDRNYAMWRSMNLVSNDWTIIASNLSATVPVNELAIPTETNAAFYRVDVQLVP